MTKSHLKHPRCEDCPDAAKSHTGAPEGYIMWHEWAEKMEKTHKQERCPTCGFWQVWVPR